MRFIYNPCIDPYYNLACEEYLLKNGAEDVAMLWRNANAVIIGRNQVAADEVDAVCAERHGVKVVRRMTGGGAVYHDLGNINYTFIVRNGASSLNDNDSGAIDFARFAAPVVAFLNKLGVPAECSGRNDITAGGKKISGTAKAMHDADVLFHGTLLVETDLERLSCVLKPNYDKLKRHGIESVSARIANLKELTGLNTDELLALLSAEFKASGFIENPLTAEEAAEIEKLRDEKYAAREWTYGEIV
ncbi:MAG: lipoate--protein ligase family protein [Firmicutes bacterium]|nr:lipoate--protein ligase family protein [Bacillota bacterium]